MTLPSNAQEGNKTSDFAVRLPHNIQLDGQWEVALVEISYPYSWNNVSTGQNRFTVTLVNGTAVHVYVPQGHYSEIAELLNGITYGITATTKYLKNRNKRDIHPVFNTPGGFQLLAGFAKRAAEATEQKPEDAAETVQHIALSDNIKFSYDYTLKRVYVSFNSNVIRSVHLSEHLQYALGFDIQDLTRKRTTARHPIDLRAGVDGFYVYCNLIESQIVGGSYVPLLRVVHVHGQYGDIVDRVYNSPHYVPILKKEFGQVEINIKSDTDHSIPFEFGKVVVKLHFRRCSLFAK